MELQTRTGQAIWRRRRVQEESGYSRSGIYSLMARGLWPKPVRIGARAVGWPAREVDAMNAARIAGRSDEYVRSLVARLERDRVAADAS
jgi:prophage regulatory protein